MARIIESENSSRRMIKLSTDDVISVVREYQKNIRNKADYTYTRDILENIVMYIPEDI